ncbi:MAG: DUF302 domain-containing protein [Geminicoccaceae bacterium]
MKCFVSSLVMFVTALTIGALPAKAGSELSALPGWEIVPTSHAYADLVERTKTAIKESPLNLVTSASATLGAKSLGQTIPGNIIMGVYGPQFAVRMLAASVQAGIEAPIRLYITENDDDTATISYVKPSHVFGRYEDGGEELKAMAAELDDIFATIVSEASASS